MKMKKTRETKLRDKYIPLVRQIIEERIEESEYPYDISASKFGVINAIGTKISGPIVFSCAIEAGTDGQKQNAKGITTTQSGRNVDAGRKAIYNYAMRQPDMKKDFIVNRDGWIRRRPVKVKA